MTAAPGCSSCASRGPAARPARPCRPGASGPATRSSSSRMNEGGVIFADGIKHDRLDFAWGRIVSISVAAQTLRFVPRSPPDGAPGPRPSRATGATGRPAPPAAARPGPRR